MRTAPLRSTFATIVAVVFALAMLRLATLLLALGESGGAPGLHVDEAQYWQWSRALDWGYYSKPPVIAVLLAAATAVFGDGVLAVKSVALILYPTTALVLGLLAARLVRDAQPDADAGRAGLMAATLFMASPMAALLGLATTTDAPLLLCWSLASLLLWRARQALHRGHAGRWIWLALGLVCGIGLLSKYSFAAWIAGALAWVWLDRGTRDAAEDGERHNHPIPRATPRAIPGILTAAGVATALVLPHLAWNAAMGWPTLQHTAEITAVANPGHGADRGAIAAVAAAIWRSLSVPLGAMLMAGPLLALLSLLPLLAPQSLFARPSPDRWPRRSAPAATGLRFVIVLHAPLLLLGMLQALRGEPQINWVAPLVPGITLLLAVWLEPMLAQSTRRWLQPALIGLSALHLCIGAALPLAQTLSQSWRTGVDPQASPLPRRLDIWARMRGWPEAYAELRPALLLALDGRRDTPVLTTSRSVIALGAHAWRDLPLHWRAWTDGGPPRTHHQMVAGWSGLHHHAGTVLVLADAPLPAGLLAHLETPERLAIGSGAAADHSRVTLTLWRAQVRQDAGTGSLASTVPTRRTDP